MSDLEPNIAVSVENGKPLDSQVEIIPINKSLLERWRAILARHPHVQSILDEEPAEKTSLTESILTEDRSSETIPRAWKYLISRTYGGEVRSNGIGYPEYCLRVQPQFESDLAEESVHISLNPQAPYLLVRISTFVGPERKIEQKKLNNTTKSQEKAEEITGQFQKRLELEKMQPQHR